MKKITYGLSGRQEKELLDRGRPLRIALPAPDAEQYDPREYVLSVMPHIEPSWIVSAEELVLPVNPWQAAKESPDSVGRLLGRMAHADTPDDYARVLIVCVVVELQSQRGRQARGLIQWAGRMITS